MNKIKFKNGVCFNTDCMKLMKEMKKYPICKYCGELIKRGKVWNKDVFGNGYHHECYLKLRKYFSYLSQSDILGDD